MAADIEFNVRNGMTVGANKHLVLDVNGALSGSDITCTTGRILSGGSDLLDVFGSSDVATTVSSNSGNWQNTYTHVQSVSDSWGGAAGYIETIGGSTSIDVQHDLSTVNLTYSVADIATGEFIYTSTKIIDDNTLRFQFNTAPSVDQYRVVVIATDGANTGTSGTGGTTNNFLLDTVSVSGVYQQQSNYTHVIYDATEGNITVQLLNTSSHVGVTQHKLTSDTTNTVTLSAPTGATIDGNTTYVLDTQYESIGIYTDGTNYFIQ